MTVSKKFIPLLFISFVLPAYYLAADPIIPDGTTQTSVRVEEGRFLVNIAPADENRVSINNYQRFNVPELGVVLDNTEEAARTIVNDVTGFEASLIEGKLEVLGTRAHVIVANRNGIKVNGGRFVNNADLILTTGSVGRIERVISNGVIQNDITLDTKGGEIIIGKEGLSGALNTLDIIANEIKIDGAITNTNSGLRNTVRFAPGSSTAELDSSLSPSNPVRSLATITQQSQSNNADQAILFEVTQQGSVSSGSISIAVTEEGAGFKHAGSLNALSGDITINVDGLFEINGGDIVARRHVKLHGGEININSKEIDGLKSQNVIQAREGAVVINAKGSLQNNGAVIRGFERDENDELSKGAVSVYANEIINSSLDLNALSVLFAEEDDLYIEAEKVENNTGRLVSNKKAIFQVGHLSNYIDISDFEGRGDWTIKSYDSKRLWYTLFLKKEKITERIIDYGIERLEDQIAFITAEEGVEIIADKVINRGGEINSNNGSVNIQTSQLENEAERVGFLNLIRKCGVRCTSYGESSIKTLGGNINAGDKITIKAQEFVTNTGGQIFSVNDLDINSPEVQTNSFEVHNVVNRNRGLSGLDNDKAFVYRQDQGGSFISNMGDINLDTLKPVEVNGGQVEAVNGLVNGELNIVREPEKEKSIFGEHIGHFKGLLD